MAKRIVVEFSCDICAETAQVTAVMPVNTSREVKLYSYPKGWQTSSANTSLDICPKCVKKANDMCQQGRKRAV